MKTLSFVVGALLAAVVVMPVSAGAVDCAKVLNALEGNENSEAVAQQFHTTVNAVEQCKTVGQVGSFERSPRETFARLSKENCAKLLQEASHEPAPVVAERHRVQVEDIERCKAANLVDKRTMGGAPTSTEDYTPPDEE